MSLWEHVEFSFSLRTRGRHRHRRPDSTDSLARTPREQRMEPGGSWTLPNGALPATRFFCRYISQVVYQTSRKLPSHESSSPRWSQTLLPPRCGAPAGSSAADRRLELRSAQSYTNQTHLAGAERGRPPTSGHERVKREHIVCKSTWCAAA